MQKLERFPSAASSRYPWWDQVLDGEPWELVRGEDFTSKPNTVISNARAQARRRGGTVRTRTLIDGEHTTIVVQFIASGVGRHVGG